MLDTKDSRASLAIFLVVAAVYLALPTRNYYWDGVNFALTIENARSLDTTLLHANHLIYNVIGYLLYSAVNRLVNVRALFVLQYVNCVMAAAAVAVFFRILRSVFKSFTLAVCLAMLFAFAATWWKFATDADAYIPSILFMLLAFHAGVTARRTRPFLAGVLHAVAMCFHQLAVLFFPVMLLAIVFRDGNAKRDAVRYALPAAGLTIIAYVTAYSFVTGGFDLAGMAKWTTTYSNETGFVTSGAGIGYLFSGSIKLFFGGRFSYLADASWVIRSLGIAALILSVMILIRELLRSSHTAAELKEPVSLTTVAIFGVWVLIYAAFLLVFIPQNAFYRLFYLPPLVVLLGILLSRWPRVARSPGVLAPVVAIVAISNFFLFIYPHSQVRAETPLALAYQLQSEWQADTVVIYSAPNTDAELVRYFNRGTTWLQVATLSVEQLEAEMRRHPPGTIWLETTAVKQLSADAAGASWLLQHTIKALSIESAAYNVKYIRLGERSELNWEGN